MAPAGYQLLFFCFFFLTYSISRWVAATGGCVDDGGSGPRTGSALALTCSNRQLFEKLVCQESEFDITDQVVFVEKGMHCFRFYKNKFQKYAVVIDSSLPCLIMSN